MHVDNKDTDQPAYLRSPISTSQISSLGLPSCHIQNPRLLLASVAYQASWYTVMFLSFRTDRSGQTVNSQIRLLLDPGSTLFAMPSLSFWAHYSMVEPLCSNFRIITAIY